MYLKILFKYLTGFWGFGVLGFWGFVCGDTFICGHNAEFRQI